ncbi:MAG: hypothetical protein RI894_1805, partial [Bacteroidota bacterium]
MNDTLTYTLLDLQTYIRRVIAANMQETVWITAELSSCSESRGHWYIDLVQKDQANIAAQASAVLWATNFKVLLKKLSANTLAALLREGVQVRMEVRVEYHERYGMKLVVQDLDPAYTLGQLEAQRRASLQRLYEERLLDKQKQIVLPIVVQRIAVISSTLSAGYQDFIQHLNHNIYGYKFQINLFDSAVQGESTVSDIVRHFDYITKNKANFDAVCVLRGGGSRLDLAAFDDYKIAASAAVLPLPLLVGIGHDIDESVLDAVAHTSLKTPTAVADFLIDRTAQFESRLLQQKQQLHHASSQVLKQAELRQAKTAQQLQYSAQHALQQHAQAIQKIDLKLPHVLALHFQKQAQNLDLLEQKIDLLQPNHILKRGFSMTLYENKPILNAADIPKNAVIETLTQTGKLKSRVLSIAIFIFCLSANSLLAQKLGPNLIDNGDFEKGNHSFSSEVPYITCHEGHNQCGNGKYMCSGTYTIAKSPYPCNPDWGSGLKDHTSKTGNMLILDYYEDHQARLWTQTVKVKPNTSYIFRTWVANLSPFAAPSSIQLIGGTQKSPIITVLNNSNWDIFSTVIKTNNETELELSINSANNGLMGYDIAFDD